MNLFRNLLAYTSILLLAASSCTEDRADPLNAGDETPGPVSIVKIESLPGGAKITYGLPDAESLLYIKAVFSIRKGLTREVRSSFYVNNLTVEGFPDTNEYEVKLYAVSRGEKISEPVSATIQPLTPPVKEIFETLAVKETYGGISLSFKNSIAAAVAITVLTPNELDEMLPVETFYTKSKAATYYSRGFNPQKMLFGIFVKDRWGNLSDTVLTELTPLPEVMLDKKKFVALKEMGGDYTIPHLSQWGMEDMWNGIANNRDDIFQTEVGVGVPSSFTIDLGVTARLSRYKFYHRAEENIYSGAAPRVWEIYGSNSPDGDGGWVKWEKIMDCMSFKPSGLPLGTHTTEDVLYGIVNGEDFNFPEGIPAYRYLRFRINETWGRSDYIHISELTFWGDVVQ